MLEHVTFMMTKSPKASCWLHIFELEAVTNCRSPFAGWYSAKWRNNSGLFRCWHCWQPPEWRPPLNPMKCQVRRLRASLQLPIHERQVQVQVLIEDKYTSWIPSVVGKFGFHTHFQISYTDSTDENASSNINLSNQDKYWSRRKSLSSSIFYLAQFV